MNLAQRKRTLLALSMISMLALLLSGNSALATTYRQPASSPGVLPYGIVSPQQTAGSSLQKAMPLTTMGICIGFCQLATYTAHALQPFSASVGGSATAQASCLPGFLAIGGGYTLLNASNASPFTTLADEAVLNSAKAPTAWQTTLAFPAAMQGILAVDIICQNFSLNLLGPLKSRLPLLDRLSIQTCKGTCQLHTAEAISTQIPLQAGLTRASATCPAGSLETSGGYAVNGPTDTAELANVRFSTLQNGPIAGASQQANQWQVKLQASQISSKATLVATAVCQQLTTVSANTAAVSCTTICKLTTQVVTTPFVRVAATINPPSPVRAVAVAISFCTDIGIPIIAGGTGTVVGGGFDLAVHNPPAFTLLADTPFLGGVPQINGSPAGTSVAASGQVVATVSNNPVSAPLHINEPTSCQQLGSGL